MLEDTNQAGPKKRADDVKIFKNGGQATNRARQKIFAERVLGTGPLKRCGLVAKNCTINTMHGNIFAGGNGGKQNRSLREKGLGNPKKNKSHKEKRIEAHRQTSGRLRKDCLPKANLQKWVRQKKSLANILKRSVVKKGSMGRRKRRRKNVERRKRAKILKGARASGGRKKGTAPGRKGMQKKRAKWRGGGG